MPILRGIAITVLVIASVGLSSSGHTQSDESITFQIKSNYQYKVQVAFWSKTRNWVWPGQGRAYDLNDSQVHDFKLNCPMGEKICYGGWVTGNGTLYWGVGSDGHQGCSKCCFTCGDGDHTPLINLDN